MGQPSECTEQDPAASGSSGGCGCAQHLGGPTALTALFLLGLVLWLLWGRRRRSVI